MSSVEASILIPAFIAGMLIFAIHIPLGQEVLKRKIVFIDLALAQIASLGIMMPILIGQESWLHAEPWKLQAFAVGFALLGAFLIEKLRESFHENQEAIAGTLYIVSFSAAILISSLEPHGTEHLKRLIDGQLLWTNPQQILILLTVTLLFYGLISWRPTLLSSRAFYYIMALVIVVSVQMIGLYLVFASLIIPALFNTKLNWPLWKLITASATALAIGLGYSLISDLPTSPLIICLLVIVFAILWRGQKRPS